MLYIILFLLLYRVSYKILKHYSWYLFSFLLSILIRVQNYESNLSLTKINKQNYNEA